MKMRRNFEQLFDVTIQPLLFTAMFAGIFGGAISGSVERLPAGDHPRPGRPDRAHRLRRHRRPAPRGHGQGRLRPVQGAADRADRAAGRADGRRHAALRDRQHADLRAPGSCSATAPAAASSAWSAAILLGDHRRLVAGLDLHLVRHRRPQRPGRAGHLADGDVPADLPVQRVRADRHDARLAAGLRRRQPGLPHHLGDPRPGQRRPGHRPGRLGAARLRDRRGDLRAALGESFTRKM